jgi:hypothetical protein
VRPELPLALYLGLMPEPLGPTVLVRADDVVPPGFRVSLAQEVFRWLQGNSAEAKPQFKPRRKQLHERAGGGVQDGQFRRRVGLDVEGAQPVGLVGGDDGRRGVNVLVALRALRRVAGVPVQPLEEMPKLNDLVLKKRPHVAASNPAGLSPFCPFSVRDGEFSFLHQAAPRWTAESVRRTGYPTWG